MKKIVFVHLLNDYSGSPKVLSQVIRVGQNSGYEVDLYTGRSEDGFKLYYEKSLTFICY